MTLHQTKQIPRLFVATKAFINLGGKILLLRESNQYSEGTNAGFFDVVGGRIAPGERYDQSLLREIKEETGLKVEIGKPFFVSEWRPAVNGEQWQVVGIFFECFAKSEQVLLGDDHNEYKWIDPKNFKEEGLIPNLHGAFETYLLR
jgi:8-oxo-dGTP diphosphatase